MGKIKIAQVNLGWFQLCEHRLGLMATINIAPRQDNHTGQSEGFSGAELSSIAKELELVQELKLEACVFPFQCHPTGIPKTPSERP